MTRACAPIVLAFVTACSSKAMPHASPEAGALRPVVASPPTVAADAGTDAAVAASCVDDARPFDPATLRANLELLASPALDGRAPGTPGDVAARTLIAERFRCLGLVPAGDVRGDDTGYEQAFTAAGKPTANVIGYLRGATKPDEIIVVGAHHDHLGGGHLGANDNASGVAAVLAVAQSIRQRPEAPARTIAFVTFGGEEQGLLGSLHYVANPPAALPLARVVQYINIDMIGSHASTDAVHAFGAFAKQPARAILARLDDSFPTLNVGLGGHSVRGDQVGFCRRGIPYVFFWTPDNRCYHERCDTVDKLDLPHLAQIAELAGGLVDELARTSVDLVASKAKIGCFGR
ncbi:MAG: M28 family peptidase [Deltaproteobacteria bacterium]|nr:M28 family peptidase [Deltaproteobacteria bacterium]MDQ3296582.1 M28 family peptidase [Myxococcota bacterium]